MRAQADQDSNPSGSRAYQQDAHALDGTATSTHGRRQGQACSAWAVVGALPKLSERPRGLGARSHSSVCSGLEQAASRCDCDTENRLGLRLYSANPRSFPSVDTAVKQAVARVQQWVAVSLEQLHDGAGASKHGRRGASSADAPAHFSLCQQLLARRVLSPYGVVYLTWS